MTVEELEAFLVANKREAETKLGCNMCKKYARCLFCSSAEKYPCAGAHSRYVAAAEHAGFKSPAWLLPEPPFGEAPVSAPVTFPSFTAAEPVSQHGEEEEAVVTVSDILSESVPGREIPSLAALDLSVLDTEERDSRESASVDRAAPPKTAAGGVVSRGERPPFSVRLFTLKKKSV